MHDASHSRLAKDKRLNDLLGDFLCAYPFLISTESYRRSHLRHHTDVNSYEDPDWVIKSENPDWFFPKTRLQLASILLREALGGGFVSMLRNMTRYRETSPDKKGGVKIKRIGFYVAAVAIISLTGSWATVSLYWLVPMFTLLPLILRIRSIAEHFGLEYTNELNSTRNTHAGRFERFFLSPHNVCIHNDHHLYPSVPWFNLPKLHAHLSSFEFYCKAEKRNDGYFVGRQPLLADLISR
jgi:fatty acid desaturase